MRKPLALANAPPAISGPKVGKYTVMVEDFESVAFKCMPHTVDILIIDEIGKSKNFLRIFSYLLELFRAYLGNIHKGRPIFG